MEAVKAEVVQGARQEGHPEGHPEEAVAREDQQDQAAAVEVAHGPAQELLAAQTATTEVARPFLTVLVSSRPLA